MRAGNTFRNEPLADMVGVGRVSAGEARLWMRLSGTGRYDVRWQSARRDAPAGQTQVEVAEGNDCDNTLVVRLPGEGQPPLRSLSRYRFEVRRCADGVLVGEGGFETAPATPEETPASFAFALMSCHQPFDAAGRVHRPALGMLRAARRCLRMHDARFVLMVGDQIYADHPPGLSLFDRDHFAAVAPAGRTSILDCSVEEVRRLYQNRYRHFWNLPDLKAIQAEHPCYMVLDDHDIVNNWGSNPEHRNLPWQTVGKGALRAYFDYQTSRVLPLTGAPPKSAHYAFTYGHTAAFVMDLRSTRRPGPEGRLFAEAQFEDLRAFLQQHGDSQVLLLVLSVPLIHVSPSLARLGARLPGWGEDFSDRWSSEVHIRDRDRLMELIYAHQRRHLRQRLILLSGDIHIGGVHRVRWQPGGPACYQMIASPLTHLVPKWVQFTSKQFLRLKHRLDTCDGSVRGVVEAVRGIERHRRNLYGGLNIGIVEVWTPSTGAAPSVRFSLYGHRSAEPVCVFRSAFL